jgi:DNA-binding NarL/FixJ family response regulator
VGGVTVAERTIRVVVVDDHPMARDWTSGSLAEAPGIEVVGAAENGLGGLRLVTSLRPDVLVLDVHLPDISGIEVARRVRAALPRVAVLIVTGFDDASYAQALRQLGVCGYMTKSASAAELVDAVRRAASGVGRPTTSEAQQALSARDRQLLALLASGRRNDEIASTLDLSLNVVEYRVGQLLRTLGVRSRAEAIHLASPLADDETQEDTL